MIKYEIESFFDELNDSSTERICKADHWVKFLYEDDLLSMDDASSVVQFWLRFIFISETNRVNINNTLSSDSRVMYTGKGGIMLDEWNGVKEISAGATHAVGLYRDGTVIATGKNAEGQCNVINWSDIIAVSAGRGHIAYSRGGDHASTGSSHTLGLRFDGTVVATGDNNYGQCNVNNWEGVIAIAAGASHSIGLLANGTVVATGRNTYGQCNVGGWTDIIAVAAGDDHTVCLRSNGRVVFTGRNGYGKCNVESWTDIIAI